MITCIAMISALEPEQFRRFCHSWYQSSRFIFTIDTTTAAALKNVFRIKFGLIKEFYKSRWIR
jgi:hypothetical protein